MILSVSPVIVDGLLISLLQLIILQGCQKTFRQLKIKMQVFGYGLATKRPTEELVALHTHRITVQRNG